MFGVVPKTLWEKRRRRTSRNRIPLAMRPLIVRAARRTLIIDAGCGDKMDREAARDLRARARPHLDHALADAGVSPDDIDIVARQPPPLRSRRRLHAATRPGIARAALSQAHATSLSAASGTMRRIRTSGIVPATCRRTTCRWRMPACWTSSMTTRASCPASASRGTGGHTQHHQIVVIESGGRDGGLRGGLMPTTAHIADAVDHGLRPLSNGHARIQARVPAGSHRARVSDLLRARPGNRRRLHSRGGRTQAD